MRVFGGLEGVYLSTNLELEPGVSIAPTFGHVFSTTMLASLPPTAPGRHHPAPWYACDNGHRGFDISAEVCVIDPLSDSAPSPEALEKIWQVASALRLISQAPLRVPAICSHSFSVLKSMGGHGASVRVFELTGSFRAEATRLSDEGLQKLPAVFSNLQTANTDPTFVRSLRYLDAGWFAESEAGGLVAVWTALESLLLEPFTKGVAKALSRGVADALGLEGSEADRMRQKVGELYNARCDAAHGAIRPPSALVVQSLSIASEVFVATAAALAAAKLPTAPHSIN
jgi:hypothetical protein